MKDNKIQVHGGNPTSCYIKIKEEKGYLVNDNTGVSIAVYKKFNFIQRFFIKLCFGLKFIKNK